MPLFTLGEAALVTAHYPIDGVLQEISPIGDGHINDTWVISFSSHKEEAPVRYCLQRINHHVFADVKGLMSNIEKVTEHLHSAVVNRGGDVERESLRLLSSSKGNKWVEFDNNYFRIYNFIENSCVAPTGSNTGLSSSSANSDSCSLDSPYSSIVYKAGSAFASFSKDLSTYSGEPLVDTIPDFHNTSYRFNVFNAAVKNDFLGRVSFVSKEIAFIQERANIVDVITKALEKGEIPMRISHNDTKINNVLLDDKTGDVLCVIDLDTIMHGSVLYDFGDAVRIAASTGDEDEQDLSKVHFALNSFSDLARGFLSVGKSFLTSKEIELLPLASIIMTLEIGMRFLTDYLEGDTYFKIEKKDHNLHRCRTQLQMVQEMENSLDEMTSIIEHACQDMSLS